MNRFISFICALCIVLSANAGQRLHLPKPAKNDKQKVEQRIANARTDKERLELTYKYKKSQKAIADKGLTTSRVKARSPKSKAEVSAVVIDRYTTFYTAEENKIFYGLHQEDGFSFFFDINLPEGKHDVEWNKEYTLEDMNADFSEWDGEDEDGNIVEHYYVSASLKKTKGEAFDVHIVATITDLDGNEFSLSYDEQPLTPTGDIVEVNIARPLDSYDYIDSDHTWLIRAHDNTYFIDLRFFSDNSESPVGEFAADDIDMSSTYILIVTDELDEYDDPITKTVNAKDVSIEVSQNGNRLDVSASILGDDGKRYDITLFFANPEAQSQAELNATNLNIDDWALDLWGEVELFASDENGNNISLDLFPENPEAGFLGSYEITPNSSNNGNISTAGEQFEIFTGSITISQDGDNFVVNGKVLAWNNVEYTLNLRTPDPVVTENTFAGDNLVIDVYPTDGYFEVAGFDNENNYILLTVNAKSVSGEYTTEDIDADYTIVDINGNYYLLLAGNIVVTYDDGNATITGKLTLVNEYNEYDQLELTLDIKAGPYVPSTRNVEIGAFTFSYTDDSSVAYALQSNDGMQIFGLNLVVIKWAADVEFGKTYTLADMLGTGTYGANYEEREYIIYQTVSFTKNKVENDEIEIIVTILDTRGNTWNLTYRGQDGEIDEIYVELGQASELYHPDGGLEYELIDVDNSFACYIVFPAEEGKEIPDDVESGYEYSSERGEIELDYSYLSIQQVEHNITKATFEKQEYGDAVYIWATIVDDRGFKYRLSYYDDGFKLTGDTINIILHESLEAVYWEEYYEWMLHAENDTTIVHFSINSYESELQVGEYDVEDINTYSSHIEFLIDAEENNWQYLSFHSVETLIVGGNNADGYTLEATAIGEDGNVYVISVNAAIEALEQVEAETVKAVKRLIDGRVVIEKDGIQYNMHGAVISGTQKARP